MLTEEPCFEKVMLRFTMLVRKEREMPSSREEEVGDVGRGDREVSEATVGHCRGKSRREAEPVRGRQAREAAE